MKSTASTLCAASTVLLLAGCASVPTGPSVMALPGTGKNLEQFRSDDVGCREFAWRQIGGARADQTGVDAGVRSAAVGTVVGAVAGAAIGGRDGAGVGAGTGLLVGSMAGTGAAQSSAYATQNNYDNAYVQCMYAKGQKVPVSAEMARSLSQTSVAPAPAAPAGTFYPPPSGIQPPPPGYAPSVSVPR